MHPLFCSPKSVFLTSPAPAELGMGTRRPGTRQDLGPGTSRGLAEESRDNTKVPGVHYSAMHKHRSVNYLNLAMISESLAL